MTTPVIMAYVPGAHVVGITGVAALAYWANNQIYFLKEGNAATDGIHQFVGLPSGDETLAHTISDIGAPLNYINSVSDGAQVMSYSGKLLFGGGVTTNSMQIAEVRAADLSMQSLFGIANNSLVQSDTTRILAPYSFAPLRWGKSPSFVDYVVSCASVGATPGEVCVLSVLPTLVNQFIANTDEPSAVAGRGAVTATSGTVFILAKQTLAGYAVPSTIPLGLYKVTADALGIHYIKLGTVSPAQVDPAWTHFTGASGIAYDQTDGNPIIQVVTTDAVANQIYFVKLNASNAAVMWSCPVNALDAFGDFNMGRHNIVNQRFYFLGAGRTLYSINTSTGVATSAVIGFLTVAGGQVSEDVNDSLILYGQWTETTTHPIYAGTYMGVLGNHDLFSNTWIRYFPNGITSPLPSAPAPFGTTPAVSINRAWTFTLDGHAMYVLDLGTEGTYLYDDATNEWCHWYTGALAQWNVANGTMWGQRIVGGDLGSTDVWEVVPTAVKDNGGALSISHIVTGGISTRSRDYTACDAIRVAASIGIIDDAVGATFNLRFSDDNGQTFSAYFPVTLTAGNYGDEIAWRSLGSFNSPGRVFELSDTGGLIRIDGCDMNPEEEDKKSG